MKILPDLEEQAIIEAHEVHDLLDQSAFADIDEDNSDDSDDFDITHRIYNINQLFLALKRDVRNLKSLGATLSEPVRKVERNHKDSTSTDLDNIAIDLSPHHHFTESIREKYPVAATDLVEHLGKATFRTWVLLLEIRSGLVNPEQRFAEVKTPLKVAPTVEASNYDSGYGTEGLPPAGVLSGHPFSTQRTMVADGDDKVAKSHAVPTIAASERTTLFARDSLPIPRLSKSAKAGQPFDCPACDRELAIKDHIVWK